jgi:hypothetical protein
VWALEVRPVALRPVIAGIRRRDHLGLRRVFRDGADSDFAVQHQLRPSEDGRFSCRSAMPLPTPLCVRSSRSVHPPTRLRMGMDFSVWTSSLGVVKGPAPRPSVPPCGGPDRHRSIPWVQGRAPDDSILLLPGSRFRVPVFTLALPHVDFPLHRHQRCATACSGVEVATSLPVSDGPAAPPKGHTQQVCPGVADANLHSPASRPRRFSRPRRRHRTWSILLHHVPESSGRRVSATSRSIVFACNRKLSLIHASDLNRPRLAMP